MTRRLLIAPLLIGCACSANPLPSGHYVITTGQETDTFSLSPAPTKYTVSSLSATASNATLTEVTTSDAPIERIEVSPLDSNWYSLKGEDSDGTRRVQATSFPVSGITMAGYDYPLFAGRTDAFCRPPGALVTDQGDHPPVGLVWGRYVWALGGGTSSSIASDSYDLVAWQEAAPQTYDNSFSALSCPEQPCEFQSFATYAAYDSVSGYTNQYALGISADWAMGIDIGAGTSQSVDVQVAGLSSWADVAGGRTYNANSGAVYIVGATRSTVESNAVLEISTDTKLYARGLAAARLNAAAAYVEGQGLVVVGGNSTASSDSSTPGVEVLAPGGDKFTSLPFPFDDVQGAALVAENSTDSTIRVVWRIGGRKSDGTAAPSVSYDLACTQDCQAQALPGLDIAVAKAVGYGFGESRIVVGEQDDGTMAAWRVTESETTAIPQRELRKSATVVELPNGFIALVGGKRISDNTPAMNLELVAY